MWATNCYKKTSKCEYVNSVSSWKHLWMCNLHNQALVYTAMSNTAIQKSNATPIRATTNTNVERLHEKNASQFSFFGNWFSVSYETEFQFLMKQNFSFLWNRISVFFETDFQFLLKSSFSFFQNRFLDCFYSPLSTLKSVFNAKNLLLNKFFDMSMRSEIQPISANIFSHASITWNLLFFSRGFN